MRNALDNGARRLNGRIAIVTGAGRGIGRAIALKLASEGAHIVVNDLDAGPADETVREAMRFGVRAVTVTGDVTVTGFADRLVGAAIELGGIDIIVNNAGYPWDNVIQKMTDEQWHAMLDVHLTAPFRILRAAAEFIRTAAKREAEEGREVFRKVVNISSIAGLYGNARQAGYAAAKAGIVGLTRTLSKEWGRYKVNVNCVAFGIIRTRLTRDITSADAKIDVGGRELNVGINPESLEAWEQMIPLGRAGKPEEAAGAVYLLCTPESDYVSGQTIVCGGGLRI